jgi:hypothetical protein
MKVLLQFRNYFLYSPIIAYNLLISHNQFPFLSRDIANIVLLNEGHALRSSMAGVPISFLSPVLHALDVLG